MTPTARPLVLLAHGTASAVGREVVYAVGRAVAQRLPQVSTNVGFVDVCEPSADQVLGAYPDAVVVPYLLTSGFHVRSDIPDVVERQGGRASVTKALGVTPEVIDVLAARLRESMDSDAHGHEDFGVDAEASGVERGAVAESSEAVRTVDAVLLTAAGSSDARARQEVLCTGAVLAVSSGLPVRVGFLSGPGPSAREVLTDLHACGAHRVAVASYLLAPGFFHSRAIGLGASLTTAPLGVHPRMVDAVVDRYLREASAVYPASAVSTR